LQENGACLDASPSNQAWCRWTGASARSTSGLDGAGSSLSKESQAVYQMVMDQDRQKCGSSIVSKENWRCASGCCRKHLPPSARKSRPRRRKSRWDDLHKIMPIAELRWVLSYCNGSAIIHSTAVRQLQPRNGTHPESCSAPHGGEDLQSFH
jgi:hypothetical protein